jgi:glycosyltransferase involved in cell wall biosynthesis
MKDSSIQFNDFNKKGLGKSGVETIVKNLSNKLPKKLIDKFQIIIDHIDHFAPLDYNKIRTYWSHLTPKQNEEVAKIVNADPKPLANGGWNKFHKIVFISYSQMENWIKKYDIPRSHCTVIKYALEPIEIQEKSKDKIVLIHQSSPQRGLSLLIDVFERLCIEYANIELKVHSSYKIYNDDNDFLKIFNEKQKEYEQSELYQRLEKHHKIHNIGYLPNEELKKSLASSHIFAYPNILPETFCLSLLEAMSAGLLCVHSDYGCLPETASNWTMMYDYHEKILQHEERFYQELKKAIEIVNQKETQEHLKKQKEYVDYLFNWERRTQEWVNLLQSLENLPLKKIKKTISLIY